MVVWKELMFQSTGVTIDAETAMTNFTPQKGGTLKEVEIIAGGIAASTLIECGYIKIVCGNGQPDLYCPFDGGGLRTATRVVPYFVTKCNLAVAAGVPVKGFYYHNVLPVTPEMMIYGTFEG